MTLQTSGPISLSQVDLEINTSATTQISMSQLRTLASVPTGPIRFSDLYGKASFQPMIYKTVGTTTFTVPSGITNLKVLALGAGAGGGSGTATDAGGGGGAGEIRNTSTFSVQGGDILTIVVGSGGASNQRGGNSTVTNGRTGQSVRGNAGFAGGAGNGGIGGTGGIAIGINGVTYYGAVGNNQGVGGGGSGTLGSGTTPSGTQGGAAGLGSILAVGTSTYYLGAGGAAGGITAGTPDTVNGGGTGGASGQNGSNGLPNTGGGGGGAGIGAGLVGGTGGSGMVILYT
jgi:hypothetical protein